jgi:hypothetical protein
MHKVGRWAVVPVASSCLLLLAVACGGGDKTVTGLVLEAVERNIVEIELLKVRDRSGKVWEFTTVGNVGISAAHLKQHQVLGQGVVVVYEEEGGNLIATEIRDLATP